MTVKSSDREREKKSLPVRLISTPSVICFVGRLLEKNLQKYLVWKMKKHGSTKKPSIGIFCVNLQHTKIFSWDDGVPRLLITENDTSYKSNIYKNTMM